MVEFEEYKEIRIGDIADFQKGFAFKSRDYQDFGTKIIRVSNLNKNDYSDANSQFIDELKAVDYIKYRLNTDDAIISTVGSWPTNPDSVVGKVAIIPDEISGSLLNQNAVRLRSKGDCIQEFLNYTLQDSKFKNYIVGTAQGSANQASITLEDIRNYTFILPSPDIQKKIIGILTSIDKRIKVNDKINRNLTEQNIAVVRDISEISNIEKPLEEICYKITAGGTPSRKKSEYWDSNDFTWFKNGEIKNNILIDSREHISKNGLDGSSANLIPANSLLFAMYCVSTPQLAINLEECTTNQAVCALQISDFDTMCYIYYYMIYFGEGLTNLANGAAQQNLNKGMIQKFLIKFPEAKNIKNSALAENVRYKIELAKEGKRLMQLRDSLLPKLMSGELDVSDLEI